MKLFRSAVVAVASAALVFTAAVPAHAASPFWRVALTRHYGPAANFSAFSAVVVPGVHDAWVLGTNDTMATSETPVAEHWNGRTWLAGSMPRGVTGGIIDASAVSSKSIWAITDFGGCIVHWNGTRWLLAKHLPAGSNGPLLFSGVTAVNDHDVWVFGTSAYGPGYGTWHYNGHTWTQVTGAGSAVTTASAWSASDIWGSASFRAPGDEIVRYNGSHWLNVTPKPLKGLIFIGAVALSAASVWISADELTGKARLIHYSSGRWTTVKAPWPADFLRDPVPDGSGGFWVPATVGNSNWLWHRSAKGVWTRDATSFAVWALAPVPKTGSLLLPGSIPTKTGSNAALWTHGTLP